MEHDGACMCVRACVVCAFLCMRCTSSHRCGDGIRPIMSSKESTQCSVHTNKSRHASLFSFALSLPVFVCSSTSLYPLPIPFSSFPPLGFLQGSWLDHQTLHLFSVMYMFAYVCISMEQIGEPLYVVYVSGDGRKNNLEDLIWADNLLRFYH